jgi:hypothetical protein
VGSKLYNLKIKALEHIYQNYKGDKSTEDSRSLLKKECGFQTESTIIILMKKIQPNFRIVFFVLDERNRNGISTKYYCYFI